MTIDDKFMCDDEDNACIKIDRMCNRTKMRFPEKDDNRIVIAEKTNDELVKMSSIFQNKPLKRNVII